MQGKTQYMFGFGTSESRTTRIATVIKNEKNLLFWFESNGNSVKEYCLLQFFHHFDFSCYIIHKNPGHVI